MREGWIKLHRSIMDHWVFKNAEYYKAWSIIIMTVNHSEKKVLIKSSLYTCKRGQSLNSIKTWTELFGGDWSAQKVRTFFKLLKEDSMIKLQGDRNTTKLTVCNYDTYNEPQQTANEQLTNSQQTANNKQECKERKEYMCMKTREQFEEAVKPLFSQYDAMSHYALFCEYWCAINETNDQMRWQEDKYFKSQITLKVTSWIDKNTTKKEKDRKQRKIKFGDQDYDLTQFKKDGLY